jgi:hypothetical protein
VVTGAAVVVAALVVPDVVPAVVPGAEVVQVGQAGAEVPIAQV